MNHHEGTSEVLFPGLPLTTCHPHLLLLHPQYVWYYAGPGINLLGFVLEDEVSLTVVSLVKEHGLD